MTVPFLKPGDTVAITAPASKVNLDDVLNGAKIMESWGLNVQIGQTVGQSFHNFSANLTNRLTELQGFLDDNNVACILAARGGYGVSDLLDNLSFSQFALHPKWVVGFSDITALLIHLNKLGYKSIHGPMAKNLVFDPFSTESLRRILFGETTEYSWSSNASNKLGEASGLSVGGNLVLLCHSLGSSSDISFDNKILFIEEVSEKMYNIDRLMVQLKRAGKLKNLAGLVVGSFTDIGENSTPFGSTLEEVILQHTSSYDYPVAFDFQFGHEKVNLPIILGANYTLNVIEGRVNLKETQNGIV